MSGNWHRIPRLRFETAIWRTVECKVLYGRAISPEGPKAERYVHTGPRYSLTESDLAECRRLARLRKYREWSPYELACRVVSFTRRDLLDAEGKARPDRTFNRYMLEYRKLGILHRIGKESPHGPGAPRIRYRADVERLSLHRGRTEYPRQVRTTVLESLRRLTPHPFPPHLLVYGTEAEPDEVLPRDNIPAGDVLLLPEKVKRPDCHGILRATNPKRQNVQVIEEAVRTIHREGERLWGHDYLLIISPLSEDTGEGLEGILGDMVR